jgi:hypothetical protein
VTDQSGDTAADGEVPTADAFEQRQSWLPDDSIDEHPALPADVPEADAIDQARAVPFDDDDV